MSKHSTAKIISIIFCSVTVLALVFLIVINASTSGQMKTIDKAYSSFSHGIYKEYSQCFGENVISEKEFDELREQYLIDWGEDFAVSAEFISREKTDSGYNVNIKVTTYNEKDHETVQKMLFMVRSNGKWQIVNA
ncbi:MAG: hypothetical protein ACI4JK_05815 [Oscillospiraceae bacterium]